VTISFTSHPHISFTLAKGQDVIDSIHGIHFAVDSLFGGVFMNTIKIVVGFLLAANLSGTVLAQSSSRRSQDLPVTCTVVTSNWARGTKTSTQVVISQSNPEPVIVKYKDTEVRAEMTKDGFDVTFSIRGKSVPSADSIFTIVNMKVIPGAELEMGSSLLTATVAEEYEGHAADTSIRCSVK
jgi:hypothetical protein